MNTGPSKDRDWAFWIGQQIETLGHIPHVHDWEISAGGDIAAWMEERHDKADNMLLVVSEVYLSKSYSRWERLAAQWAAANERPNFALPVIVEACKLPTLLAQIKRCDLYGIDEEDEARRRLADYLTPAAKPSKPIAFPPKGQAANASPAEAIPFPAGKRALSNIPIAVPLHFLGRDGELDVIDASLKPEKGSVAITALHGCAAPARRRWLQPMPSATNRLSGDVVDQGADHESTMRADLVALGVRLGWVGADEKEEPALKAVREGCETTATQYCSSMTMRSTRRTSTLSAGRRSGARSGHVERAHWRAIADAGRNRGLAQRSRRRLPHRAHRA